MKYKLKKSLLALIFAPFALTLMANSAAPRIVENDYTDFTYTIVEKTYHEDVDVTTGPFTYLEFEITNTGEYYTSSFYIKRHGNEKIYLYGVENDSIGYFDEDLYKDYYDIVITPGGSKHAYCKLPYTTPDEISNDIKIYGSAYSTPVDSFILGEAKLSYVGTHTNSLKYPYVYKAEFSHDYETDSNYVSLFFTISYKGEKYCFNEMMPEAKIQKTSLEVYASEEIELDEVSIINVKMVKGHQSTSAGALGALVLGVFLFICIAALALLVAPPIIVGIILLIVFLVKRHNRKEREEFENY